MPAELNFFDTYTLMAVQRRAVPRQTFFRDRYFGTDDGDIFNSDKVLTEYMDGDRKIAAFVGPRVGAIPMERTGYEIHEFEPAAIGVSRELSADDLTKRGFGEAIYANSSPAKRAARLVQNDLVDMDNRIIRTEEWMCAQTMLENGCTMQEMIDNQTKGEAKVVKFYNPGHENDHLYTVAHKWSEDTGDFFGDVPAMCRLLSKRGLRAVDLLLGADVYDAVLNMEKVQRLLDKNSGIGYYKSLRSHNDGVYYQSTFGIEIVTSSGYIVYAVRRCGTFPKTATQGGISAGNIIIVTDEFGGSYAHPRTGQLDAGTFPATATQGRTAASEIEVLTVDNGGAYAPEKLAGTYPETATQGFDDAGYVVVQTADGSSTYAAPASGDLTAGLHPATATSGGTSGGGLVAEESGLGVSYIAKVCGSAPGINF